MTAEDCGKMKTAVKVTHLTQKGMRTYSLLSNNIEMSISDSSITLRGLAVVCVMLMSPLGHLMNRASVPLNFLQ